MKLRSKTPLLLLGLALVGLLAVLAAGSIRHFSTTKPARDGTLKIAASFYPLAYFTQSVAGSHADVVTITPAGAEPHDYELTAGDVATLAGADLVVANGILEPWLPKIENELTANGSLLVVGKSFATHYYTGTDAVPTIDPHVWLSPKIAGKMVNEITNALVRIDPAHANDYRSNKQVMQAKLASLDEDFTKGLSRCSLNTFITSHSAFGYLAADYGLTQISIAGLSPDADPSPQQLASVADLAKTKNIHYIFFESLASPKLSETLAREVGTETLALNPLEGLTKNELAAGQNYFTEMQQNLTNLKLALGCQ